MTALLKQKPTKISKAIEILLEYQGNLAFHHNFEQTKQTMCVLNVKSWSKLINGLYF